MDIVKPRFQKIEIVKKCWKMFLKVVENKLENILKFITVLQKLRKLLVSWILLEETLRQERQRRVLRTTSRSVILRGCTPKTLKMIPGKPRDSLKHRKSQISGRLQNYIFQFGRHLWLMTLIFETMSVKVYWHIKLLNSRALGS